MKKNPLIILLLILTILVFSVVIGIEIFVISQIIYDKTEKGLSPTNEPIIDNDNRAITEQKKLKTLWEVKGSLIEEKKDFIEVNLKDMKLRLYKEGEIVKEYPVFVKGKEDDWGETVAGLFKVKRMRTAAFSNLGDVYMPWWMEFWGNYSIHGWPYYPGGVPAQSSFSSGCINLRTTDAEELYGSTDIGFPVLILEKDFENDNFSYPVLKEKTPIPDISAKAYLAADLKNNFIFLEKDSDLVLPIASITKLMTALVASENFLLSFKPEKTTTIKITRQMTLPIGETVGLVMGERYSYFELLYPLLMLSSNDVAESFAIYYGKEKFLKLMNDRSDSLGMTNTEFTDTYGYDSGNISTAEDLFYLARYLLNNRRWLLEISRGKIYYDFGENHFENLKNFNLFADHPDFIGGKVGSTTVAKKTGLFLFSLDVQDTRRPIAIIILSSDDNQKDTEQILDWIKENYAKK